MALQPNAYVFTRGEDVVIPLENTDGAVVTNIVAGLKRRDTQHSDPKGPVVVLMTAEARDSLGAGFQGGWLLSLSPAQSVALTPGWYALDARLTIDGGIEITDPVAIQIRPGVMESAG